jgi:DNA ligase-1
MKQFERLVSRLDATTSVNARVRALVEFYEEASDNDKVWCIALFTGKRPKRTVAVSKLRSWAAELAVIPEWLFEETYHAVGDLSETISLLVAAPLTISTKDLSEWMLGLQKLDGQSEEVKKTFVLEAWSILDASSCFIFNKLITGGWRVGISGQMIIKSLVEFLRLEESVVAQRLAGNWQPGNTSFNELLRGNFDAERNSGPYPFCLAHPFAYNISKPSDAASDFLIEWKWDGIRVQLIKRKGEIYLWSRGEELISDSFPEIQSISDSLPDDSVFDGELLAWSSGEPAPFSSLQKRLGRKNPSRKILADNPVKIVVYDMLEFREEDLRNITLRKRRDMLGEFLESINSPMLCLSKQIPANTWEDVCSARTRSRDVKAEGVMIKKFDSPYVSGRKRGFWWKWKVDPLCVDAVLVYAMRGHGRRANLYTDYTFAVWEGDLLLPIAKAYSGLTDEELIEVDRFVKGNTLERFGPVRSVNPQLVFEIAFEGIAQSPRHKSGIALRFPRINRWRRDKIAAEADTMNNVRQLLQLYEGS